MKNVILSLFTVLLLLSCNDGNSKKQRFVPESSGNINNITVVVDNLLWEDTVGEAIRNVLAAPLEGLPQDEPIFSISQMPTQVFSGFATKNRTVLKIEKGKPASTSIINDAYARPQTVAIVRGQTNEEIIDQLNNNAKKIVSELKKTEIKEQQRRISLSLFDDSPLEENFGIEMKFPTAYRVAKSQDQFF